MRIFRLFGDGVLWLQMITGVLTITALLLLLVAMARCDMVSPWQRAALVYLGAPLIMGGGIRLLRYIVRRERQQPLWWI